MESNGTSRASKPIVRLPCTYKPQAAPVGGVAGVPLSRSGISAYALNVQVLHPGPNIGFVAVGPGDKTNVVFSAAMFNGAPGVPHGGSEIRKSRSVSPSTPVVGPDTTVSWSPNGYIFYNNTMYDHNVVTEFSWNVPGYRGYWYLYVRSLCSHTKTLGSSAQYRFGSLTALTGDKASAGWHY